MTEINKKSILIFFIGMLLGGALMTDSSNTTSNEITKSIPNNNIEISNSEKTEYEQRIEELQSQIENTIEKNHSLENQISELETQKEELKSQNNELNNTVNELKTKVSTTKTSTSSATSTQTAQQVTKSTTKSTTTTSNNPSTSVTYVLNTNSKKFHRSGCSSVSKMKESNKEISNDSRESIISRGYSPCKNCNP